MYAIIEDGAHQYRVSEGDTLDVQLHELNEGQKTLEFDKVVMIGDGAGSRIGQPYVAGAKVVASVEGEMKGQKIYIQKFRRRKNYARRQGHRQEYLRVKIEKIVA